jgi:hypothetical protein
MISNRKNMNFVFVRTVLLCLLTATNIVVLSGCSTGRSVTAGAAVPAAFAGDTVLLPLQYLGNCSDTLIRCGYEVGNYMNQYGDGTLEFVHRPNSMDLFYYVPGYGLGPFLPFSKFEYYSLTDACMEAATGNMRERQRAYIYAVN